MDKIPTIHVDLDVKCKRCGKGGAMRESGICMACMTKAIKHGELDHILKRHKPNIKEV